MKICRVETKKEVVDVEYEVCDDYCCDKMKEWLHIAKYSDRRTMWYNTETGRYILKVRTTYDRYGSHNKDDCKVERDMLYCPFCGTKLQEPKPIIKAKKSWRKKK